MFIKVRGWFSPDERKRVVGFKKQGQMDKVTQTDWTHLTPVILEKDLNELFVTKWGECTHNNVECPYVQGRDRVKKRMCRWCLDNALKGGIIAQ